MTELERRDDRIIELEDRITRLRARNKNTEAEVERLQSDLDVADEKNAGYRARNDDLAAEVERLRGEVELRDIMGLAGIRLVAANQQVRAEYAEAALRATDDFRIADWQKLEAERDDAEATSERLTAQLQAARDAWIRIDRLNNRIEDRIALDHALTLNVTAGLVADEPKALDLDAAADEPKRMLLTHPHDGHGPDDTCFECAADGGE